MSAAIDVMNCVPLMSESPSFDASRTGVSPAACSASAPDMSFPPKVASPSPTSGSARWASGARSPLAPTDPRAGTWGTTPALSASIRSSTVSTFAPEYPFASVFARRSIAATDDLLRIRLADAARVRAQQAHLQLLGLVVRDRLGDEAAEPGVDAVGVLPHSRVEERARGQRALATEVTERDVPPVDRDLPDLVDRQVVAGELDRCRHGRGVYGER